MIWIWLFVGNTVAPLSASAGSFFDPITLGGHAAADRQTRWARFRFIANHALLASSQYFGQIDREGLMDVSAEHTALADATAAQCPDHDVASGPAARR